MSVTNFLQGIGTSGVLQVGPNPAGGVLFVNSANGVDNRGRVKFPGASAATTQGSQQGPQVDPAFPLATLAYALTFTKAGRGDVIVLMAGHAETLTANVTCSTAGTLIVGLGNENERPTFTMAGFSIILSGVGSLIQNVICACSTTAITAGAIQLTGAGSIASQVKITSSNVTTLGIVAGAANVKIDSSEVLATTTGAAVGISIGAFDNVRVVACRLIGIFATACINFSAAATDCLIDSCRLIQLSGSVKPVIAGIVTAVSGLISNNSMVSLQAAAVTDFYAGTNVATNVLLAYNQNFGTNNTAGPTSGILCPAAGTV